MFPFAALFTSISQLISGWLNGKLEVQKAKVETAKAAESNKTRLLADEQSNNHAWEMTQLTDSDKPIRRICFCIFSTPFIWAIFDPIGVQTYFTKALDAMPSWYIQMYMMMVGGIWGFKVISPHLSSLISSIKK